MKKYSKPTISVKYYCTEDFCSSISTCDYWSCLVNSNQHEYVGNLNYYESLSDLLSDLSNGDYGYCTYTYGGTTYYIWTSSYSASESTDGAQLEILKSIVGVDYESYIKSGKIHFTSSVTESTVYSS